MIWAIALLLHDEISHWLGCKCSIVNPNLLGNRFISVNLKFKVAYTENASRRLTNQRRFIFEWYNSPRKYRHNVWRFTNFAFILLTILFWWVMVRLVSSIAKSFLENSCRDCGYLEYLFVYYYWIYRSFLGLLVTVLKYECADTQTTLYPSLAWQSFHRMVLLVVLRIKVQFEYTSRLP
jgi:hypothetical protein